MVGGALVNALSFTGGNYLFSLANNNGSMEKIKRHIKVMEELSHKRDEWNKQQREVAKRKQKSVRDCEDVGYASELYNRVTRPARGTETTPKTKTESNEASKHLVKEPSLSDYYHPSEDQRKYEYIFIVLGMGVCFYASYKLG